MGLLKKKSGRTLGVAALALGLAVFGQTTHAEAETLEDALISAYNNNPSILARRAYLRAIDEGVPVAQANWHPSVKFTADVGHGYYESNAAAGVTKGSRTSKSMALTVSQPLYRGGRTVAETRKADYTALAERSQLEVIESTVFKDIVTAYMNAYRDRAVMELNASNEAVLKSQLEAAEDRFRVGDLTRTDVAQAEARLAGATADTIAAQGVLENSRATFKKLVGYEPTDLQEPQLPANVPQSVAEAMDLATLQNPSVVYAQYTAVAALHNVELIRGELRPDVSLDATADRTWRQSSKTSRTESLAAVVTLTVPIYQAGNVYGRIREAKHTAGQRRIEIETNRRESVEAAQLAWENIVSARARVTSHKSQIVAAEVALEGVEREAEVGLRTILDVLDAEQEVLNAKVNLVKAERDVLVAGFDLLAATGQMTAVKLGLPVQLYDPNEHYREVRNQWFGSDTQADQDNGQDIPEDYYYVNPKQ